MRNEIKWIYLDEWLEYFENNKKALKKTKKPVKKKEEPKSVEVVMPEFEFYTKQGNFRVTTGLGDVFLNISTKKGSKVNYTKLLIHFRKGTHHKFKSDYIVFAVYQNRIYFKESDIREGFKITNKNNTSGVVGITIGEKDIPKFEPFLRKEFKFLYDEIYKMYYVEIGENEVK